MRFAAGLIALLLAACAAPDAPAQPEAPVAAPPAVTAPAASPAPAELSLNCAGAFTQGGVALCRTLSLGTAQFGESALHVGYLVAVTALGIVVGNRTYVRRLYA